MADSRFYPRGCLEDPKASRAERILARILPREDIPSRHDADSLYMRRFPLLSLFGRKVMLHCFYRSDEDPDCHDHPWDFITLCLAGGYEDEEWDVYYLERPIRGVTRIFCRQVITAWSLAFRKATHKHRVRLSDTSKRTWTLVFTGKKRREWFFYTPAGPVHNQEYLSK